jgi:hypothetical protein
LGYKDGIPTAKLDYPAIGREFRHTIDRMFDDGELASPSDFMIGWSRKCFEFGTVVGTGTRRGASSFDSATTKLPPRAETVPAFIAYDKLVLSFSAYFKGFLFPFPPLHSTRFLQSLCMNPEKKSSEFVKSRLTFTWKMKLFASWNTSRAILASRRVPF